MGPSAKLLGSLLALAALAVLPATGCGSKSTEEAKKDLEKLKKKEKPKPPFEPMKIFTEPNERAFSPPKDDDSQPIVRNALKPGHWTSVLVEGRANNFDFSGELVTEPRDNQQKLIELEGSPFGLIFARPAVLPKGQRKSLEALFFSAPSDRGKVAADPVAFNLGMPSTRRTSSWVYDQLHSSRQGIESPQYPEPVPHMPSFQYYIVVFARESTRYRYLKVLDSIRPPGEATTGSPEDTMYYRVLYPQAAPPLALPSHVLCWTSVAYLIWDDVLPATLTPEQQQAVLDWVHWGGGLIISGPQSLDALRGTFLEPYLPATATGAVKIDADALAELSKNWTISDGGGARQPIQAVEPLSGVKLVKDEAAQFVAGTGELVAERRLGRGRIVVTAFRLSDPAIVNWRSFDSFFNAGLLGRPPRVFDFNRGRFEFTGGSPPFRFDPGLTTKLRIFSRDAADEPGYQSRRQLATVDPASTGALPGTPNSPAFVAVTDDEFEQFDLYKAQPGVAAWNDFSKVSVAASQSLREAAGISVPKREFVLWMVGAYLVLIVPINWLVFRLLGRVEWAWIAVPFFAVGWGAAVIWLAQLNIGFARAETEVAVLELQPGFPRAHLTRYTALYSSLSTSYDIHLEEPTAVAQPFAVESRLLQGQTRSIVKLRNVNDRQLTDFLVSSNSTGVVHSEQMVDIGGAIVWRPLSESEASLENNTSLSLHGATILRRRQTDGDQSVDELAWIGDLEAGKKVDVRFEFRDDDALKERRDQSPVTAENRPEATLGLRRLVQFAENEKSLAVGDVRLVAWRDESLAGIRIEPAAAQSRSATLVVANLEFGGEALRPDSNLRSIAEPAEPEPPKVSESQASGD